MVLTRRAAYFTDSMVPVLYRVDIGRHGELSEPVIVPLSGDVQFRPGFNLNGIDSLPGGRELVTVQSPTGQLFRVDAHTGVTREIALDQPVTFGDGILRQGDKLYVVRNRLNQIAVVDLDFGFRRGEVEDVITDPRFDVPTTIAPFRDFLYAVNARFDSVDDDDDDIVRVEAED